MSREDEKIILDDEESNTDPVPVEEDENVAAMDRNPVTCAGNKNRQLEQEEDKTKSKPKAQPKIINTGSLLDKSKNNTKDKGSDGGGAGCCGKACSN